MKSRGFTLLETLVALVILVMGGAGLWWGLRQSFVADQRLRQRETAFDALVSEAERLQGRRQEWIRDTVYELPRNAEMKIRITRTVLDSARREDLLNPLLLDERLRQAWRNRPMEVLLEARPEPDGNIQRLFIVLPEYE